MKIGHFFIISVSIFLLCACEEGKDWEKVGYQDGYAATFNTGCSIRASIIHGKWDIHEYSKGYSKGAIAAAADIGRGMCNK